MPIHVRATRDDIADVVLLPGNPDRALEIAERHLDGAKRYTTYRQMWGYTGTYRGRRVSVQTTGMGAPSAAIVVEELLSLGAKTLIRLGTCGAVDPELSLGDVLLVTGACAANGATQALTAPLEAFAPVPDFSFCRQLAEQAEALNLRLLPSLISTQDLFYDPSLDERMSLLRQFGIRALEMEASMVLTLAARAGARGAVMLTVSDIIHSQTRAEPEVIARGVEDMTRIVLETVAKQAIPE